MTATAKLHIAGPALAVFVLWGCNRPPEVCPPSPGVAPVAAAAPQAPTPAGSAAGNEASAAPAPATSGGFSLPIGADIPPAAAAPAKEPLRVPPLAQQPQAHPPGQNPPGQQPQVPAVASSAGSPAPASGKFIQLSAGIAVPQFLPTGTCMSLSVDYSLSAAPRASHYLWVVKSASGEIVNEVKLESSGNLSAFFQQLRPEHRPFSVRIEEVPAGSKSRTVVSNELTLKTDY